MTVPNLCVLLVIESSPRLFLTTFVPHLSSLLYMQWLWVTKSEDKPEYKGMEDAVKEASELRK